MYPNKKSMKATGYTFIKMRYQKQTQLKVTGNYENFMWCVKIRLQCDYRYSDSLRQRYFKRWNMVGAKTNMNIYFSTI